MRIVNIAIILFIVFVVAVSIFAVQINYSNAAITPIPDICSDNLLQKQNEVTCYNDAGATPTIGVHAECCVTCESDTAVCTISKPGTPTWYDDNEQDSSLNYIASGTVPGPPNFLTCSRTASGSCPAGYSSSTYEGYNCNIYKEKDVDNIFQNSGRWDTDQQECVTCSGAKINKTCATTADFLLDASGNCTGMGQSGKLDSACGASADCDEKSVGDACGASGNCDNAGACVVANALNLNIVASSNPVDISATSTVTFTVMDPATSSAVSGATVAISVITCGTLPNPGSTTDGAGKTNSTFTAPAAPSVCTVTASASKAGFNTGTASYSINVINPAVCAGAYYGEYNDYRYAKGQSIELEGLNPDGFGNFYLCIYDPSGNLKRSDPFVTNFPQSITFAANTTGTWRGLSIQGVAGCPGAFDAALGCVASTDVVECEGDANCTAPATCDLSTYTCSGGGGGGGGGSVASPFCETSLVAGDEGKLCGTSIVTAADVAANGWCCSAFVLGGGDTGAVFATQIDCQAMDPACSGGGGGGGVTCAAGDGCKAAGCAPPDPDCGPPPPPPNCAGPGMFISPLGPGYCTIGEIFTNATNWILSLVASIIILIIIIGGLMYISSSGDEEKLRTSKNIILYAMVGLGIILISYALITEVTNILKG